MAEILRQLYNEQGQPFGSGATSQETLSKGLLHGASHIWFWRTTQSGPEILLQKRAHDKVTWPDRYDTSAAGHIDQGESPLSAALREVIEELGIKLQESDLILAGVHRAYMHLPERDSTENEYQWIYLSKIKPAQKIELEVSEVASYQWMTISRLKNEIMERPEAFVSHGHRFFDIVFEEIERLSSQK